MSHKNIIPEYLKDEDLDEISAAIGKVEKLTSGELRVCIKKKRGFLEKKKSPRKIAVKEFRKLKMHRTSDKTGVLIFIIFDEHMFEIVADEGIDSKISQEKWNSISEKIKLHFSDKEYLQGLLKTISDIGEVLIREFPVKEDDRDELSNEVIIKP